MNRIDFDKMEFTANGKLYKIDTDAISYPRLVVYLDLMPVVAIGKSHLEIMNMLGTLYTKMTTGDETLKETHWNAAMTIYNFMRSMDGANSEQFLKDNTENILRFCALFCIADGEDTTKYNKHEIDRKVEDFKQDCDMFDFFFLSKLLTPLYQKTLTAHRAGAEKMADKIRKRNKL